MSRLIKKISKQAEEKGICGPWLEQLQVMTTVEQLADMYHRGIDFCMANDFPPNDFIRRNFKGKMEQYGIHLDEEFVCQNQRKVVALGSCRCTVEASDFQVSEVFVRHTGELNLMAGDMAFVVVDAFDDSVVRVKVDGKARVAINKYGNARVVTLGVSRDGYLRINNKNKKTYGP